MVMCRPARNYPTLILLVALAAGCGPAAPAEDGSSPQENGAEPSGGAPVEGASPASSGSASQSAARVALPGLFSIMVGLQGDMARLSRGLWIEDFDSIASAADAVADHPRVPQEEFQRISDILGPDMSRFGGMDQGVHDLAVELSDAAGRGALDEVLTIEADLRRGCVACHSEFRDRLRESLATQAPTR